MLKTGAFPLKLQVQKFSAESFRGSVLSTGFISVWISTLFENYVQKTKTKNVEVFF